MRASRIEQLVEQLRFEISGQVAECSESAIRAYLPGAAIGDQVGFGPSRRGKMGIITSYNSELASAVCIDGNDGIRTGEKVYLVPSKLQISIPENPLGLAISATGEILDGEQSPRNLKINLSNAQVNIGSRSSKIERFDSGINAVDSLLPVAIGQRMLVCAEPGVGKTQLLTALAEQAKVDIIIFALIGERGREAHDFFSVKLASDVRKKSVIVVSTSDESALKRVLSAQLATSLAERYQRQGKKVLLLFDSLTRYLRANRDLALASGEPPIRRGYPASVFSDLPKLLERAGNFRTGSITAFYTMLLSSEIDEDPMLEEVKGILDGHLILRRKIAERGIYPAISISESLSRLAREIQSESERENTLYLKRLFSRLESDREMALFVERLDPELELALKNENLLIELVKGRLTASEVTNLLRQ